MRDVRIVEGSVAMSVAAVAGACAFLLIPLDLPGVRIPRPPPERAVAPRTDASATAVPTPSPAHTARAVQGRSAVHGRSVAPPPWLDLLPPPATASPVLLMPDSLRPLPPPGMGRGQGCENDVAAERAHRDSRATSDVLFLLGTERHAVGDLRAAADYYEAFALHDASRDGDACTDDEKALGLCADAARALETAIALRRGIGDEDRAQELSVRYVAAYGETRVSDAARVSLVAGRALIEAGRGAEARRHLREHTRRFARHVPIGARIRAWVARGAAERAAGRRGEAARSFRRALSLWSEGGASIVAMRLDEDGEELGTEFARTLDAVAEAGFHLAEARYDRYAALAPPRYEGHGERREVERWVARQLRPWMVQKLHALSRAEAAYRRVAALGVTRHRIAADARRGVMYRDLLETITSAPGIEVHEDGEVALVVRADWRAGPIARLRARATEAFESCLETALRSRQLGRDAAICASELSRVDPMLHPVARELSPSELLLASEPAAPGPIVTPPTDDEICSG